MALSSAEVSVFDTLQAFDLWRQRDEMNATTRTIAQDVEAVLAEIGYRVRDFDGELRVFLQALLSRAVTVPVKELMPEGISASTFYRRWRSSLPATPKRFLVHRSGSSCPDLSS